MQRNKLFNLLMALTLVLALGGGIRMAAQAHGPPPSVSPRVGVTEGGLPWPSWAQASPTRAA